MSSVIYNLGGTDKTLILEPRARMLQSFAAPNWTDLRLSIAMSLTKPSDPNDPTGLAESIGAGEDTNQVYIGFKSTDAELPPSSNFFGLSSRREPEADSSATTLADDNQWVWERGSGLNDHWLYVSNGTTKGSGISFGVSPHFRDTVVSDYATLVILQMLRNNPTSNLVDQLNVVIQNAGAPADYGTFLSDTSIGNLRSITAGATYTNFLGPFTFTTVPNAIFLYWPFVNSRLRIHSYVLERYA